MTNSDICLFSNFRTDLQNLINDYIEKGLPATFQVFVLSEAYTALTNHSNTETEAAFKARAEEQELLSKMPIENDKNYGNLFDGDVV